MEEQLINFETAKLAKDKGFDAKTNLVYAATGILEDYNECRFKLYGDYLLVPTQSLLQKWLREEFNIDISLYPEYLSDYGTEYRCRIYVFDGLGYIETLLNRTWFETYEDALEAGLQEALKLI